MPLGASSARSTAAASLRKRPPSSSRWSSPRSQPLPDLPDLTPLARTRPTRRFLSERRQPRTERGVELAEVLAEQPLELDARGHRIGRLLFALWRAERLAAALGLEEREAFGPRTVRLAQVVLQRPALRVVVEPLSCGPRRAARPRACRRAGAAAAARRAVRRGGRRTSCRRVSASCRPTRTNPAHRSSPRSPPRTSRASPPARRRRSRGG